MVKIQSKIVSLYVSIYGIMYLNRSISVSNCSQALNMSHSISDLTALPECTNYHVLLITCKAVSQKITSKRARVGSYRSHTLLDVQLPSMHYSSIVTD